MKLSEFCAYIENYIKNSERKDRSKLLLFRDSAFSKNQISIAKALLEDVRNESFRKNFLEHRDIVNNIKRILKKALLDLVILQIKVATKVNAKSKEKTKQEYVELVKDIKSGFGFKNSDETVAENPNSYVSDGGYISTSSFFSFTVDGFFKDLISGNAGTHLYKYLFKIFANTSDFELDINLKEEPAPTITNSML